MIEIVPLRSRIELAEDRENGPSFPAIRPECKFGVHLRLTWLHTTRNRELQMPPSKIIELDGLPKSAPVRKGHGHLRHGASPAVTDIHVLDQPGPDLLGMR